jgi:hypothetical protein
MNKTIKLLFALVAVVLLLPACNKGEGKGGTGTIQGCVKLVHHPDDDFALTVDTMAAAKTDVFIIYGDDAYYGDDTETGYDGMYQFEYLTPGNYTVYSYSTLPSGEKVAVSETVTLNRGAVAQVPTIYIHDGKAYGTSIVKGQVIAAYYVKDDGVWQYHSEGPAYEQRVYIRKAGEELHFDDTRTGVDGCFAFQKLQPGEYEIFTVTEDAEELPSLLFQTITVGEAGQVYELEEPFVIRINL